jgi:hypothetical protein
MDVIRSAGASKGTTVTDLLLNVGDYSTLGDGVQWENVSDSWSSVLACVDELVYVHSVIGDEDSMALLNQPRWFDKVELINHLKTRLKGQCIQGVS